VRLPDELGQAAWPHAFGQRSSGLGLYFGVVVEQIHIARNLSSTHHLLALAQAQRPRKGFEGPRGRVKEKVLFQLPFFP
jgi:hypothetical protein